jgi:hypothetical protein
VIEVGCECTLYNHASVDCLPKEVVFRLPSSEELRIQGDQIGCCPKFLSDLQACFIHNFVTVNNFS